MTEYDVTRATTFYPQAAVEEALGKISTQGLWLLLSIDHYGWRAEYDAIRVTLAAGIDGHGHYAEHAPLVALGQMFAFVDKLWRLVYGIRAHRDGGEFLNAVDGYLAPGYKLDKKLEQLETIPAEEWKEILGVPTDEVIFEHMAAAGATADDIARRLTFAREIPGLIATNMREAQQFFKQDETTIGPRPNTYSVRELDGQYRHGAPVLYHDCSPTDTGWRAVDERGPDDHRGDTIGIVMTPPDADGAAFVSLFKHDAEMRTALLNTSTTFAVLVRRLARAHLLALSPTIIDDPLAAVADYET